MCDGFLYSILVAKDLPCQLVSFGWEQEISLARLRSVTEFSIAQHCHHIGCLGDNIRVLDWVIRRVNGEEIAEPSAVGLLPKKGSVNLEGLNVEWDKLMAIPKDYWVSDIEETLTWLDGQLGDDLPEDIRRQIEKQKERFNQVN